MRTLDLSPGAAQSPQRRRKNGCHNDPLISLKEIFSEKAMGMATIVHVWCLGQVPLAELKAPLQPWDPRPARGQRPACCSERGGSSMICIASTCMHVYLVYIYIYINLNLPGTHFSRCLPKKNSCQHFFTAKLVFPMYRETWLVIVAVCLGIVTV